MLDFAVEHQLFEVGSLGSEEWVAVSTAAALQLMKQSPQAIEIVVLEGLLHRPQSIEQSADEEFNDLREVGIALGQFRVDGVAHVALLIGHIQEPPLDQHDEVAAFGGCIAANRSIDKATAEAIFQQYAEVVVAPDFEPGVMDIFARKKNLRVIRIGNIERLQEFVGKRCVDFKSLIDGGIVAQWSFVPTARSKADLPVAACEYKGKTYRIDRTPTDREYEDLLFGWLVESGITSNSVIYVKDRVTVGIGTGEQDRVGVAEIARDKAYRKLADRYCFKQHAIPYNELDDPDKKEQIDRQVADEKGGLIGAVMVSDAFFPFRDGVDVGIGEGVSAVVQPGGSGNDYQSIEACNEADVTMVYTGQRSFKH